MKLRIEVNYSFGKLGRAMPKIIKEYLNASNFFLNHGQTKYLNALLDNIGKKLRSSNA